MHQKSLTHNAPLISQGAIPRGQLHATIRTHVIFSSASLFSNETVSPIGSTFSQDCSFMTCTAVLAHTRLNPIIPLNLTAVITAQRKVWYKPSKEAVTRYWKKTNNGRHALESTSQQCHDMHHCNLSKHSELTTPARQPFAPPADEPSNLITPVASMICGALVRESSHPSLA